MKIWNFGIIGPGKIANRFADAFQFVPRARVYAIASRDDQKRKAFAERHKIEKVYSTYEEMLKDSAVDIVYVATPHTFHFDLTLLCLTYGKAVLCEKPFTINYKQVEILTDKAKEAKVFMMEGMWSRFFPAVHKTLELLQSGVIGDLKYLQADFGFAAPVNPESRIYSLELGGGAQLDVGVYPLFLAMLIMGKPDQIKSMSCKTDTGADASTDAMFYYDSGKIAHIFSSIVTDSPKEAHLMGTKGSILIESPWYKSQKVSLRLNGGEKTEFPFPHSGNGFEFQIEEIVRCLDAGKTECEMMPHSLSLLMAEVSDEIRRQGDVRYPGE